MKYPIEHILQNEKILCHEVRSAHYKNQQLLLHFFITQSKDKEQLPKFKMGYERYKKSNDESSKDDQYYESKPYLENILDYSLIYLDDTYNTLFNPNILLQKNEWTGEQLGALENKEDNNVQVGSIDSDNVSMNTSIRYVAEMADNSIYNTDDIVTENTYLAQKQEELSQEIKPSDSIVEMKKNESKTYHSIWNSSYHFDKYRECREDELVELFTKYQPYISTKIPVNLDTESKLNIDMESIFGTSFDIVRIKTKLFHDDDDDNDTTFATDDLVAKT